MKCQRSTTIAKTAPVPVDMDICREPAPTKTCPKCGACSPFVKSNVIKALCCDVAIRREDLYKCPVCKKTFKENMINGAIDLAKSMLMKMPDSFRPHYREV